MKYYLFLILFFFSNSFRSQEINNDSALKKCRKDFNKKICLSDDDKDGIIFYLDKCPKEKGVVENNGCPWPDQDKDGVIDKDDFCPTVAGPQENNGCPWPDIDGDGILDKDDNCPTIPGLEEYKGCPKPYKPDCKAKERKDSLEMAEFRSEYKDIDEIYNKLNSRFLDPVLKKFKIKKFELYLEFINWGGPCDLPGCCPNWKYNKSNYLISKFWNKKALESYVQRKNLKRIWLSSKLYPSGFFDFKDFIDFSLYSYLIKHYEKTNHQIVINKNEKTDTSPIINVRIYFETPYKITISIFCSNSCSSPDLKYEYNGKDWNRISE